jgi:hypothetical protein
MKHLTTVLTMLMLFVAVPVIAAPHDHSGHNHGAAKPAAHQGHEGHDADGNLLELGSATAKGVEAHADLKDVRAAMAKVGMKHTHHLMVMFHDEKTGKSLESGKVAVKITAPDGTVSGPFELIGMDGHFGADVTLGKPGEYQFQVGSKLADGTSRQFEFKTLVK